MAEVLFVKSFSMEKWMGYLAAVILGLLILVMLVRSLRRGKSREEQPDLLPYCLRDDFVTEAEFAFYTALRAYLDDSILICPKVNLADLFFPSVESGEKMRYLNKINRKHVDFLLCDAETLEPVCGVELDDSSHQREDRIRRDQFVDQVYNSAGFPLVHVPLQNGYSVSFLQDLFEDVLEICWTEVDAEGESIASIQDDGEQAVIPTCPKCGALMVLRVYTSGEKKGYRYYGCPHYPRCRETIDYVRPVR